MYNNMSKDNAPGMSKTLRNLGQIELPLPDRTGNGMNDHNQKTGGQGLPKSGNINPSNRSFGEQNFGAGHMHPGNNQDNTPGYHTNMPGRFEGLAAHGMPVYGDSHSLNQGHHPLEQTHFNGSGEPSQSARRTR
jgi:hypothetical protein